MAIAATDTPVSAEQRIATATALILCGGLKPPPLAEALRAPLLSLPQNTDQMILDGWLDGFRLAGIAPERCHMLVDANSWCAAGHDSAGVSTIADTGPYRGPAGALRDAIDRIEDSDLTLIIESSRMLANPASIAGLMASHLSRTDSITIATNPDGSFAGVIVADRPAIDIIPGIGFIDLKEQWLPAASKAGFGITTHQLAGFSYSARTSSGYLNALHRMGWFTHRGESRAIGRGLSTIFGTPGGGSLIARTARVAEDAVTSDSAISDRAVVASGAVVVRSIIGRGAVVENGDVIIDTVIPAADVECERGNGP